MVGENAEGTRPSPTFQYSLCRVVLMVYASRIADLEQFDFQYSLCRVVLMVESDNTFVLDCVGFQYSLCRVVLMVSAIW